MVLNISTSEEWITEYTRERSSGFDSGDFELVILLHCLHKKQKGPTNFSSLRKFQTNSIAFLYNPLSYCSIELWNRQFLLSTVIREWNVTHTVGIRDLPIQKLRKISEAATEIHSFKHQCLLKGKIDEKK